MEPEYEQYGLTEEEWNALTDEERESYRNVGQDENMGSEKVADVEEQMDSAEGEEV